MPESSEAQMIHGNLNCDVLEWTWIASHFVAIGLTDSVQV